MAADNPIESIQLLFSKIEAIAVSMARLETKFDSLGNVKDIAIEALQSAKSAHHRIDNIEKEFAEKTKAIKEENNIRLAKIEKVIYWAGTTIIGGVALGAISLLFHFAKN